MKLVFDRKGVRKDYPYSNVIAIPTSAKEKRFFDMCKDANGNYKLWVYKKLYELDKLVIDNPMADDYDEDGNLIYDSDPTFVMLLDMARDGNYSFPLKPSNVCILSLYCVLSKKFRKSRRVKLLYDKMIDMLKNQSVVIDKVKENVK